MMRAEVVVPKEYATHVVADLLSRRGQIQADTDTGNTRSFKQLYRWRSCLVMPPI
jgi:translation elongation factor EF-G